MQRAAPACNGAMARSWDADTYHRVSAPLEEMGRSVLGRLSLHGSETVVDAGCGTGRVTALVADRLPRGRVIGVDASMDMVERARAHLGSRAEVLHADLLELTLDEPVDAVLSTATFHWILDHDRLFARLLTLLRPGGALEAQCGGRGNIAGVLAAADEVSRRPEYAHVFGGWRRPMLFASPEETETRLRRSGFVDVSCWLEARPVVPDDPHTYLATIPLGPHLERLRPEQRRPFVEAVEELLPKPITVDYVRLNISCRRPDAQGPHR